MQLVSAIMSAFNLLTIFIIITAAAVNSSKIVFEEEKLVPLNMDSLSKKTDDKISMDTAADFENPKSSPTDKSYGKAANPDRVSIPRKYVHRPLVELASKKRRPTVKGYRDTN